MNTFGKMFKFTTFGESHGPMIGCVVDGVPSKISLDEAYIQKFLDKRKPNSSRFTTTRNEADKVKIVSGVFEGMTTGTPIALLIENSDARSKDYDKIKETIRPSHADFTYFAKYGIRDYRGGGRASARETAMRVAAGAIARKILGDNIKIKAYITQIGKHKISRERFSLDAVDTNPFFCPDLGIIKTFEDYLDDVRKRGMSVGAMVEVVVDGVPVGLGNPVYGRLDADIASALMGINAAKGVEIGDGMAVAGMEHSENVDEIRCNLNKPFKAEFLSNHAGGMLGGISTGQRIIARVAFKPTPSSPCPFKSIETTGREVNVKTEGRHDPCVGIRGVPVVEAMMANVLADHYLNWKAYL
ncbi:MAG: Chorismate synthase [Alphaproteobacteria bacterium ADurb.Bin438]|nr:MAG: Chorismate synthase [Alphaproteobacteria bacterium ADurb.Bin438]